MFSEAMHLHSPIENTHCRLWLIVPEREYLGHSFLVNIDRKNSLIHIKAGFEDLEVLEDKEERVAFEVRYSTFGRPDDYDSGVAIIEMPNADRIAFDLPDVTAFGPIDANAVYADLVYECDILFDFSVLKS